MLPRYFNAMVKLVRSKIREAEKTGEVVNDIILHNHLYTNGFNRADIAESFDAAKARAIEHIQRANANGGRVPVRIRIFDVQTDTEDESFTIENFLAKPNGWIRSKILYAVNNRKALEISAIDD